MKDIKIKLDVWVQVMANINGKYAQEIAKDINTTYSYVHKIIKNLEDMNLIQSKKIGRKIFFYHTEKGEEIGNSCNKLVNFVNHTEKEYNIRKNSLIHLPPKGSLRTSDRI